MVNPARVYTLNRRRAFRGAPTNDVETQWFNTLNGMVITLLHSTGATVLSQKEIALPQIGATPIENYTATTRPNRYSDALVPETDTFADFGITAPDVLYVQTAPVTPQQVQNLQAITVQPNLVRLDWDDNPGQSWGERYSVERKTGVGGAWAVLDNNVGVSTYEDSTVAAETTYFYRVREYIPDSPFIGPYSSELQVDTPAPSTDILVSWFNTQTGQSDFDRSTPDTEIIRTEKNEVLAGMGYAPGVWDSWKVGLSPGSPLNEDQSFADAGIVTGAFLYLGLGW